MIKALAAKTAQGPKIQDVNINVRARLRSIVCLNFPLQQPHFIFVDFDHTTGNRELLSVHINIPLSKRADQPFMIRR